MLRPSAERTSLHRHPPFGSLAHGVIHRCFGAGAQSRRGAAGWLEPSGLRSEAPAKLVSVGPPCRTPLEQAVIRTASPPRSSVHETTNEAYDRSHRPTMSPTSVHDVEDAQCAGTLAKWSSSLQRRDKQRRRRYELELMRCWIVGQRGGRSTGCAVQVTHTVIGRRRRVPPRGAILGTAVSPRLAGRRWSIIPKPRKVDRYDPRADCGWSGRPARETVVCAWSRRSQPQMQWDSPGRSRITGLGSRIARQPESSRESKCRTPRTQLAPGLDAAAECPHQHFTFHRTAV